MIVIAQNGKIVPRIIPNKALLEVPLKIMKLIKSFKELTIIQYYNMIHIESHKNLGYIYTYNSFQFLEYKT